MVRLTMARCIFRAFVEGARAFGLAQQGERARPVAALQGGLRRRAQVRLSDVLADAMSVHLGESSLKTIHRQGYTRSSEAARGKAGKRLLHHS